MSNENCRDHEPDGNARCTNTYKSELEESDVDTKVNTGNS